MAAFHKAWVHDMSIVNVTVLFLLHMRAEFSMTVVRLLQGCIKNLLEAGIETDPALDQDPVDITREQEDQVKKACE